ncbi:MAG: hypothetical protein EPN91_12935 [Salinibacterium sp.]|nr:MAG: hypothetical protein EPN91_12935 [Salinibacterium sp.]
MTSTPTATSEPLPDDALLRVSATIHEANGATADLVQTVYKPVAPTAADKAQLTAECNIPGEPGWQTVIANPLIVKTTMTATMRPRSPKFTERVSFGFVGFGPQAYSGDEVTGQSYCAEGAMLLPGTVHGIAAVPSSDPVHGLYGWAGQYAGYGFSGSGNLPADDPEDGGGTAVVSNCVVELSPEAAVASAKLAAWPARPYKKIDACAFSMD